MSFPQRLRNMTEQELFNACREHAKTAAEFLNVLPLSGEKSLERIRNAHAELRLAYAAATALEQRLEGHPAPKLGD